MNMQPHDQTTPPPPATEPAGARRKAWIFTILGLVSGTWGYALLPIVGSIAMVYFGFKARTFNRKPHDSVSITFLAGACMLIGIVEAIAAFGDVFQTLLFWVVGVLE
ncbi:MAG: hypothetical protein E6Q88_03910 [Lysobacteraceae bacterium]|nr:MAG: hypothetical protein E6Q88_03910 [Xanthomonadaceae bacterium]